MSVLLLWVCIPCHTAQTNKKEKQQNKVMKACNKKRERERERERGRERERERERERFAQRAEHEAT